MENNSGGGAFGEGEDVWANCVRPQAAPYATVELGVKGDPPVAIYEIAKGQPWHFVRNEVLGWLQKRFGILNTKRLVGEGLAPPAERFATNINVGTGVPDGPQICNLRNCRNDDAAAEAQRGLVTSLEPDAKEGEMLANASRRLAARPPPLETSPCPIMFIGDASLHRASGEYQGFSF